MEVNIEDIQKGEITDEELQGIYIYLSMYYNQMTLEEKRTWYDLMQKLDPEFNIIEEND
jgi:hypothetical protein